MKRLSRKLLTGALAVGLGAVLFATPRAANAQVVFLTTAPLAPPVLPIYTQPEVPSPNFMWVPGYWAFGPSGYYWVPGMWVNPPAPGLVWTPGYWSFDSFDGDYVWNPGYWASDVGYYGGVDYGYGYPGTGFYGGYWNGPTFYYNTAFWAVNPTVVRTTFVRRVIVENFATSNRICFNGGPHGISLRPTEEQIALRSRHHFAETSAQRQVVALAERTTGERASVNHGRPMRAALSEPVRTGGHVSIAPRGEENTRPSEPERHEAPMTHENAPPVTHENAPPVVHEHAAPVTHANAPPVMHEQAPPVTHQNAPPVMRQNAPPVSGPREQAPPPHGQPAPKGAPPAKGSSDDKHRG